MTRLSEALKRAEEESTRDAVTNHAAVAPSLTWQFAPVETMHVPPPDAPDNSAERWVAAGAIEPGDGGPSAGGTSVAAPAPLRQFGAADRHKLVVDADIDPAMVEQYRHLAAVMHHAQKASGVSSVMITSALPAEGKTLTATNLALTLSESYQRRVLLIDADLRRPRMRDVFGLPATAGLTDSLATPRDGRLPVHQVTPTLWVLTAGRALPDPMSLLVSPAMKELLDDAKDSFDWVVVDSPPIAILPDANLLAAMIDTTLLVVSARSTPYPMVQRAAQAVGTNRILGVVLNRAARAGLPSNYGYYGQARSQMGQPSPAPRRWLGWLRKRGGAPHAAARVSAGQRHVQ
jgi:protein-tyrosine kinase